VQGQARFLEDVHPTAPASLASAPGHDAHDPVVLGKEAQDTARLGVGV
jgi:hypothetical protein